MKMKNAKPLFVYFNFLAGLLALLLKRFSKSHYLKWFMCNADAFQSYPSRLSSFFFQSSAASQLRSFQLPQYLSSLLGGCSFLSNWEKVEPWHWLKCHLDSSSSSNEKVLSVSVESVGLFHARYLATLKRFIYLNV